MKVYQLVVLEDEVAGHGSYAPIAKLASKDVYRVKPFALYTDRAKAEAVAAEAKKEHFVRATVIELDLY